MQRHEIGLNQARQLCQMSPKERLSFIAEGLHVILASAEGFWKAATLLEDQPREAEVLEGFAKEEAAKILILIDAMRSPKHEWDQRFSTFIRWFYDHHARLMYNEILFWKPVNRGQLREYVDNERRSHTLDGAVGEYIVPAGPVYKREQRLYADVEAYDDGNLHWNEPTATSSRHLFPFSTSLPVALRLAQAMQRVGLFSLEGLTAVKEVWGGAKMDDTMALPDNIALARALLARMEAEGRVSGAATEDDVRLLLHVWPHPLWGFELKPIPIPLENLKAAQERALLSEMGDPWREDY